MKNNATFKFKIKESVQYASHANKVIINTALTRALALFNLLNTQKKKKLLIMSKLFNSFSTLLFTSKHIFKYCLWFMC